VFCGNCGAQLGQQAQPTQQMPAAQQPQQPTQQMPAAQQAPPQQPTQQWQQPGAPPPPSSGGGKTALIIILVLALLGMCAFGGLAGWFWYAGQAEEVVDTVAEPTATPPATATTPEPTDVGFMSSEEALLSQLPAGWVYQLAADTPDLVEYWAGPPASEWASVYIVERNADGTWYISDAYEYTIGFDDQSSTGGGVSDADQATLVVEDFLIAIMNDQPDAAQALTVSPFRDDPASASYSNGDFYSYSIDDTFADGDGTYSVIVTEEWAYGTDTWRYHVVPTEIGWRINELEPY
jgi:hypothetical protein